MVSICLFAFDCIKLCVFGVRYGLQSFHDIGQPCASVLAHQPANPCTFATDYCEKNVITMAWIEKKVTFVGSKQEWEFFQN